MTPIQSFDPTFPLRSGLRSVVNGQSVEKRGFERCARMDTSSYRVLGRARSSLISLFCSATGFVVKAARQGSGECQFARLLAAVLCFGY